MRWVTMCALLLSLATPAVGERHDARQALAPARPMPAAAFVPSLCVDFGALDIRLPQSVTVDAFEVEMRPRGQVDAVTRTAAEIALSAGAFARVLHVPEDGEHGLRFTPGLRGNTFRLALNARAEGGCLGRVILYSAGMVVAVIHP